MQWIEISLTAHPEAVEAVSEALAVIAANGIAIDEPYTIDPTLDPEGQSWRPIPGAPVTVRAYIAADAAAPSTIRQLQETLWHLGQINGPAGVPFIGTLQTRQVDDADWAEAWKEHYYPLRIGQRFVIKPSWRTYDPRPDDVILTLDPGMAFGTGTHPTTRLCLEAIESIVQPGDHVLDVGSGSGILAIAALKRGAAHALAVDVSAEAVRATAENARLNDLADRLAVMHGKLEASDDGVPLLVPLLTDPDADVLDLLRQVQRVQPAQVVVANIIARIIGELAPALLAALAPGGTLIASGIIQERRDEAEGPLLAAGLIDLQVLQEGDWLAIIGRRPI